MSKSKKSTRCCPARKRVVASSHTSVNPVESKKQSILDAIVASARIVARKMTFVCYEFSKGPPIENEVF
jgi:hypothetical protein